MENQNLKFEQLYDDVPEVVIVYLDGVKIGKIAFKESSCMWKAEIDGAGHRFILERRQLDAVKNRIRDKFEE